MEQTFHLWRRKHATLPPPTAYFCYLFDPGKDYVLQAGAASEDDGVVLTCWDLAGRELLRLKAKESDLAWTRKRIANDLQVSLPNLRVALPDGQLLVSMCRAMPLATIATKTRKNHTCITSSSLFLRVTLSTHSQQGAAWATHGPPPRQWYGSGSKPNNLQTMEG